MTLIAIGLMNGCISAGDTLEEPNVSASQTPSHTVDESMRHEFTGGPKTIEFAVSVPTTATVELWFEGVFVREQPLAIMLLSPDGQVRAEARTPAEFTGGALSGRTQYQSATLTLEAGTWSVSFEGRGKPAGLAEIRGQAPE